MMQISLFTDGDRTGCVKLQAPELADSDSPPRVVVGVLDGSGSMSGKPLQDAKLALQWVVRQLRPNVDSFGLVYFASEAKLQIPVTVVTDTNSLAMRTAIASLQTAGSTNLEAGLRLALEQLPEAGGGSLVLATDGIPNVGATLAADLVGVLRAGAAGKAEVRLDTAGLGPQHNEDLLTSLASELDGVYTFLESSDAIQDWAATRLGDALTVSARQVECTVHGSVALRLEGVSASGQTVKYPTMSSGEVKHILVTLADTPLSVTVEYLDNDGALDHICVEEVNTNPLLVDVQRNRWKFIDAVQQAKAHADQGQLEQAQAVLQAAIDQMEASPSNQQPPVLEFLERMRELIPMYHSTLAYTSLGRQRTTEAARGYTMERDVGGRGLASAFTNPGQALMRQLSAPPAAPEGGGAAAAAAPPATTLPPPPPRMLRSLSVGVSPAAPVWQWMDEGKSERYMDFLPEQQRLLEDALARQDKTVEYVIGSTWYTAYLEPMVQMNQSTKFVRQIKRHLVS